MSISSGTDDCVYPVGQLILLDPRERFRVADVGQLHPVQVGQGIERERRRAAESMPGGLETYSTGSPLRAELHAFDRRSARSRFPRATCLRPGRWGRRGARRNPANSGSRSRGHRCFHEPMPRPADER